MIPWQIVLVGGVTLFGQGFLYGRLWQIYEALKELERLLKVERALKGQG